MINFTPLEQFKHESIERVKSYATNKNLQNEIKNFSATITNAKSAYNYFYLGVPIIQGPQDLYGLQEIIWETKPELIIETGIAWGGSLIYSASMMCVLEACDVIEKGHVIGIDIDIRSHNKESMKAHPLGKKITMLEGSSIDENIVTQVKKLAEGKRSMVCLDSHHSHDHVLAELEAYAPLVAKGCYCMVGDTGIENHIMEETQERPWGKGNNPKTAVWEFLKRLQEKPYTAADGDRLFFETDKQIEAKILVTSAPDGFLKRL